MVDLTNRAAEFSAQYKDLMEMAKNKNIRFLQSHVVDNVGRLRSKLSPFKLSNVGESLNAILYCVSHGEGQPDGDIVFDSEMASDANGYPNIQALADPNSLRFHNWRPDTASVFLSGYMLDGSPCPVDSRHILLKACEALHEKGFQARVGVEYEFGIFHADEELMQQGRYRELRPWGQTLVNYEMNRNGEYQDLMSDFLSRMASLNIGIASVVSEYGFGMYELALSPKPALEAADDATRAKFHLNELCAERGLVATFMTRFQPPGRESACGAHHHLSLWQDDKPILAAGTNKLSKDGMMFLAGMLEYLTDTHVIFRPTINSYRRFDRGAWSPEDITWGYENRTSAIRAITTPGANACRFEHRVAGSDVNPYLTTAAILAAGTEGLELGLMPPEPMKGMAPDGSARRLQSNLKDATDDFVNSSFCNATFGSHFVKHYAESRFGEVAAFEAWQNAHITDFEWERYFI